MNNPINSLSNKFKFDHFLICISCIVFFKTTNISTIAASFYRRFHFCSCCYWFFFQTSFFFNPEQSTFKNLQRIPSKWICFLVEKRTRNSSRIVLSLTIRSIPLYSTTENCFHFFPWNTHMRH